jgi:ABC-type multidrug transport system fused ATPase/permease subunit
MIHLLNQTRQKVVVKINDTSVGIVAIGKSLCINVDASQTTQFTLCHEKDSYKKSGKAYMNIETTYELLGTVENAEFVITSNELNIDSGIYYHYLILAQGGKNFDPVQYKVQGLEGLKKTFASNSIKERLVEALMNLLTEFLMAPIVTIAGAIVIIVWLGWKWLLIILLGLYLLSFIGEMFGEWFYNIIAKLVNKNYVNESMEQKIERFSQTEVIEEYYIRG